MPPSPQLEPALVADVEDPEPWSAPRCVLLSNDGLITVFGHLWVDSLHVQIVSAIVPTPAMFLTYWHSALFLTNTVMQGDQRDVVAVEGQMSRRGTYVSGASSAIRNLACGHSRVHESPMKSSVLCPHTCPHRRLGPTCM